MFNRAAFWNTRPDGIGVLEVVGDEGAARRFVPLRRTAIDGAITGPLAALRVVHTYGFSRADSASPIEALYRFPLPGDAAVTGVTVRFGAVEIVAELAEREGAEQRYAAARERGESAALTTREAADLFTLRVTGLRPDEPIVVETTFVQLARPTAHGWSIRLPLTTAPRYVREDERGARSATVGPLALARDPSHRFALDLTVRGGTAVASPTHPLAIEEGADAALRVRLRDGEVVPDRDFLLTWAARGEATRPALTTLLHDDPAEPYRYFLALVAPPQDGAVAREVAREVTLLVDHSGSMTGPKWEAADWATRSFLGGLGAGDEFALGLFHDTTHWFAGETRPATGEQVAAAIEFLLRHRDSGGTNLGLALEGALRARSPAARGSRSVLVVTDAAVSDAARVLRLADEEAQRPERRRISILCIDASPNDALATELAERGGGIARFLTSAPEEDDITTALDEVLADWAAPVQTNLRLLVDRPVIELARGRAATADGWSTLDLGDLPIGRAIWAVGRLPRDDRPLAFQLVGGDGATLARRDGEAAGGTFPALKALFGARRIAGLEYLLGAGYDEAQLRDALDHLGYDPDRALAGAAVGSAVYAENRRADTTAALRGLLVAEALDYGLASTETAFVAVRHEAGERVGATVIVPNALPTGWSPGFLGRGGSIRQTGGRLLRAMSFSAGAMPAPAAPSSFVAASLASPMADYTPAGAATAAEFFAGVPRLAGGEAILFDSATAGAGGPTPPRRIGRLSVQFPEGTPAPGTLDPGLALALYLDDLAAPRATVRLAELVRQGGERPLNLSWREGQVLRIVLVDPSGAWGRGALRIAVALG